MGATFKSQVLLVFLLFALAVFIGAIVLAVMSILSSVGLQNAIRQSMDATAAPTDRRDDRYVERPDSATRRPHYGDSQAPVVKREMELTRDLSMSPTAWQATGAGARRDGKAFNDYFGKEL